MKIYHFVTGQLLPIGINEAWDFFSSAKNLALITPPELHFKILTELPEAEVYEGMIIDYKVKPLLGIQVQWRTEICAVDKPVLFTDRQLKGPYRLWEHTHTFTAEKNGVWMRDSVKYQLPLGFIGTIAHSLVVRNKIREIFSYRKAVLDKMFNNDENLND
ncbi:MAG TPA: SRPBCC family protein [Agriterribacter sp.]|nr:SRPBCC family protein [Agriterribacter sp.]